MTTNSTDRELTALYNYLMEIKPYHTKIRDMVVKYTYTDSFNVSVDDSVHSIFTHLTSLHKSSYYTPSEFGTLNEAKGKFSGTADGSAAYKKWKLPDPHFGISSLVYDHKQPLIATSTSGVTTFTQPTYIDCDFSTFELGSVTRLSELETGVYTSTYILRIVGTLVFKSYTDLSDASNLTVYYKTAALGSSAFTKTVVTDVDGNFKYTLISVNIDRNFYIDSKKYDLSVAYIGDTTIAKPNIDVSSSIVKSLLVNIVVSEKLLYTVVDSTINPFSYTDFGVKSTPSHQIGVIDEVSVEVSDSIHATFAISNASITVDNVGYVEIVNEAWDITRYEEASFDINTMVPAQKYDPSVLTMDVVATYNVSDIVESNQNYFIGDVLVASTDSAGSPSVYDSKFTFDGHSIVYTDNVSVALSTANFTPDELEKYCNADSRTINNVDAIFAIITNRVLKNRYAIEISRSKVGTYLVPYNDYVSVYVNGDLMEEGTHYIVSDTRDLIEFKSAYAPALYDQLTFDLYNFGRIFVSVDGVSLPIDYDASDMIVVKSLKAGWDSPLIDGLLTANGSTYSISGVTEDIILSTANVYIYDHTIVNGEVILASSGNKSLYGYVHRMIDTSGRIFHMFEFVETPSKGSAIDISVLQHGTYKTLAHASFEEKLFFTVKEFINDVRFESRVTDILYVDETAYFDFMTYDDEVECSKSINKLVISHQTEETLKDKLKVYDESGVEVTDYVAVYEMNKTKIEFADSKKYVIKMKTKEQP